MPLLSALKVNDPFLADEGRSNRAARFFIIPN